MSLFLNITENPNVDIGGSRSIDSIQKLLSTLSPTQYHVDDLTVRADVRQQPDYDLQINGTSLGLFHNVYSMLYFELRGGYSLLLESPETWRNASNSTIHCSIFSKPDHQKAARRYNFTAKYIESNLAWRSRASCVPILVQLADEQGTILHQFSGRRKPMDFYRKWHENSGFGILRGENPDFNAWPVFTLDWH